MAKSRITPEKYSGTTQVEHFGKLLNELSKLGTVISTSFGPLGRLKFLQTSQGGHVTVTSSSKRILNQLPPGHPVMHIIISAVREHLARFDDGGLFLIQLTINLITSASRLSIPNHSIIACYEFILKCCIDFFQSDTCPCRINVDISSIKTMLAFMKSILCTKPTCTLNDSEISHLSLLLIKGFVNAIPSPTSQEQFSLQECIQFIHCYGESASESKLLDGILIDNSFTLRNDRDSYANKFQFLRLPDNTIRVILFNISLAGDPEDSLPENITLIATKDDRSLKLSSIAMERFRRLIEILKANHVGFVGCQKCVHPTFKLALETNGIFVCDRLSILNIGKVKKITGATVLSTSFTEIKDHHFGAISDANYIHINNKCFLNLIPSKYNGRNISTIAIISKDETSCDEIKLVLAAAINSLQQIVTNAVALCGSGCTELTLVRYLQQNRESLFNSAKSQVQLTKSKFFTILDSFQLSLIKIVSSLNQNEKEILTEVQHGHHWIKLSRSISDRCRCGMKNRNEIKSPTFYSPKFDEAIPVKSEVDIVSTSYYRSNENIVLDSFAMKINAYHVAISVANIALRIINTVSDAQT